jgi:hypothetical protein
MLYLAVYDGSGRLVALDYAEKSVNPNSSVSNTFSINADLYPADSYAYRAFFWDENFIPLCEAILPK